eukprot:COSAG01_NODE_1353_length_10613_cov_279.254708_3_plen_86_part_00
MGFIRRLRLGSQRRWPQQPGRRWPGSTRGLVVSLRRLIPIRVVTRGAEILGVVLRLSGRRRWHARMRVRVGVRVGVRIRSAVLIP